MKSYDAVRSQRLRTFAVERANVALSAVEVADALRHPRRLRRAFEKVIEVLVHTERFLIAALLGCFATAIAIVPVKAVPIARGLPALAVMLEEASPQKAEPIFFAQSLSSCGNPTGDATATKLTLLTLGADTTFELLSEPERANEK